MNHQILARMLVKSTLGALLAVTLGAANPAETPKVAAGHRLAARLCGECHAVDAAGASPLRDAPPFRSLYRRFDVAGLPLALEEGMMVGHPRMPLVQLDIDEVGYLTAYLKSFIPAGQSGSTRPICEPPTCVL